MIDNFGGHISATGPLFDPAALDQVQKITEKRISEAAAAARDAIRDKAPRRTGKLQGSIETAGTGPKTTVFSTCPYGVFVEKGQRHERGGSVWYVQPKPFFFTKQVKRKVNKVLSQILGDVMEAMQ